MTHTVKVNRAPVLTLWAAIVAERLGHDRASALTLGRAVAGLNAQAKARALGMHEERGKPHRPARRAHRVELLGREVPVVETEAGVRAVEGDRPVDPASVERYLEEKFGDSLADVRAALRALARAYPPSRLAERAYALYERFRPQIPPGKRGWGAAGDLDLDRIHELAKEA